MHANINKTERNRLPAAVRTSARASAAVCAVTAGAAHPNWLIRRRGRQLTLKRRENTARVHAAACARARAITPAHVRGLMTHAQTELRLLPPSTASG